MHSTSSLITHFSGCPDCDMLLPCSEVPEGHSGTCPRCGKTLCKKTTHSVVKALSLSITGLLIYVPAITLPLLTLESHGFNGSANILESVVNFYRNDYYFVASMVLFSAVVFPLILLICMFTISFQLNRQQAPPFIAKLFRLYLHLEEWAMVEVYLLGILITIIKMADSSDIYYHSGIICFSILVLISLAISTIIDHNLFWHLIENKGKLDSDTPLQPHRPNSILTTACNEGLVLCHICHKLSPADLEGSKCPRCGEILHSRKPHSISRTTALVLTSTILLIPANVLPIMRVDFLGLPDRSTIMDGIIYFFHSGSYAIGLIIFAASVLVPVFKIIGLTIILTTTRPCGSYALLQKTRLFRFIAFIGRWSMLDIFVIALLTVLVDFGFLTSIHTAPAATYFCFVVVSTMLAATAFDPRIMWDKCNPCQQTISNHHPAHE